MTSELGFVYFLLNTLVKKTVNVWNEYQQKAFPS